MKAFRKNVALAIDGGGIRGIVVTQALAVLEAALKQPVAEIFHLAVGTSTGSIISAGIAAGYTAKDMTDLYYTLGKSIFPTTLRKLFFPITRYRYPSRPFEEALDQYFGRFKMGDFWQAGTRMDLVVTAFDLEENRTRFIKPWKDEYANWPLSLAVQASCTVRTYFPIVENRYIDGGVGSYGNPGYIAAYEARECLNWDPSETTLISIGTGRSPYEYEKEQANKYWAWDWLVRILGIYAQSANDLQVHLIESCFKDLDYRRFQINLRESIPMDGVDQMDRLVAYGARLGRMIVNDQYDPNQGIVIKRPRYF